MKRFNFLTVEVEPDPDGAPEGYQELTADPNEAIGAEHLSGQLIELPAGEKSCPYHWEAAKEEWLLVLRGAPTIRHPEGETELRAGDLVCFPTGPAGAHQLMNRSSESCRVIMFSDTTEPNVIMYPDSGKVGVRTADLRVNLRADATMEYWDGE